VLKRSVETWSFQHESCYFRVSKFGSHPPIHADHPLGRCYSALKGLVRMLVVAKTAKLTRPTSLKRCAIKYSMPLLLFRVLTSALEEHMPRYSNYFGLKL
jgi:hypothetical protein